jgi:hypothetical protein
MVDEQIGPQKQTQKKEEEEEAAAAAAAAAQHASTDLHKCQASGHFQKHLVNSILLVTCGCHSSQLVIFHNFPKKQSKSNHLFVCFCCEQLTICEFCVASCFARDQKVEEERTVEKESNTTTTTKEICFLFLFVASG